MDKRLDEGTQAQTSVEAPKPKKVYKTPEVIVHGKVEKMTLATAVIPP